MEIVAVRGFPPAHWFLFGMHGCNREWVWLDLVHMSCDNRTGLGFIEALVFSCYTQRGIVASELRSI